MGDKAATALFEETQRPDYRDRWGKILAAVSFFILTLLVREYIWTVVCLWLFFEPFRPMATRLTAECLRTNPGSVSCTVQLDQILRCEVVEYRTSFWHGVIAPGMVFPSQLCSSARQSRRPPRPHRWTTPADRIAGAGAVGSGHLEPEGRAESGVIR